MMPRVNAFPMAMELPRARSTATPAVTREISAKSAEAGAATAQILAKTIMGEMSMDDFEAAVKDWKQKYGFMLDTQNKWIVDNKDKLKSRGVKIFEQ